VAARLVDNMTRAEAGRLVQGVGWRASVLPRGWYVASVLGVPRLAVPSLHMQDASHGFRTLWPEQAGQVTAWPCLLALGATWDASLARAYGAGVAAEFRAKGANVLLGPSVNVHRVARNGRNAEYLSGEEPSLGAVLAAAYVRGAQSQRVAAVVKHFALNSQETLRDSQDSVADERTMFEVYYPPFQAAVEAGVASVMCAYNQVNGTHACGSRELLIRDLRGRMGFRGWVMSDWWAVHAGADVAAAGVDQSLPGNDQWFDPDELAAQTEELSGQEHDAAEPNVGGQGWTGPEDARGGRHGLLGGMAARVLAGALWSGALSSPPCTAGCDCGPLMLQNVASSPGHRALARQVAGASVVLLKNSAAGPIPSGGPPGERPEPEVAPIRRPVLPLQPGARVALLGAACDSKPIGGEGGFKLEADAMPDDGTGASSAEAANATGGAVGGSGDGPGGAGGYGGSTGSPPPLDARAADWTAGDYYTVGGSSRVLFRRPASVRFGLLSAGVQIVAQYSGDDPSEAAAVAAGADVAIACGGGTTQEARDRPHLQLDQHDFLFSVAAQTHQARAAGRFPPLVTVALAPGAILANWADASDAAVLLFLGGEATGEAIADVLTGRISPTGRLPVTAPRGSFYYLKCLI
jgi:beta-glucosidase